MAKAPLRTAAAAVNKTRLGPLGSIMLNGSVCMMSICSRYSPNSVWYSMVGLDKGPRRSDGYERFSRQGKTGGRQCRDQLSVGVLWD
jgi:hypothetical protein